MILEPPKRKSDTVSTVSPSISHEVMGPDAMICFHCRLCKAKCERRKSQSEVAQLCLTLCNSMDCSPPSFSIHGFFQARILEWVAISFSRGSSTPWDWTQVSCIAGRHFTFWATREAKCELTMIRGKYIVKSSGFVFLPHYSLHNFGTIWKGGYWFFSANLLDWNTVKGFHF